MKILVLNTPEYDFCSASLIEGLHCLIERDPDIELQCLEPSNYAKTLNWDYCRGLDDDKIIEYGKEADLIIQTSNRNQRGDTLAYNIGKYDKTVYIDGEDVYSNVTNPENFALYFKRELRTEETRTANTRPFPFAIERRYFARSRKWDNKKFVVACMFGPHDDTKPWRRDIEAVVRELNDDLKLGVSCIGSIYGGKQTTNIDTGSRAHDDYFNVLGLSEISVDGYGAHGCNAARFWESLASHCCLVTQKILIDMPNSFENGKHLFEFETMDELKDLLTRLADGEKGSEECEKVATAGFDYAVKYHTVSARAHYLLEECRKENIMA